MFGPEVLPAAGKRRHRTAGMNRKNRLEAGEDVIFSGLASEGRGMAGFVPPPAES